MKLSSLHHLILLLICRYTNSLLAQGWALDGESCTKASDCLSGSAFALCHNDICIRQSSNCNLPGAKCNENQVCPADHGGSSTICVDRDSNCQWDGCFMPDEVCNKDTGKCSKSSSWLSGGFPSVTSNSIILESPKPSSGAKPYDTSTTSSTVSSSSAISKTVSTITVTSLININPISSMSTTSTLSESGTEKGTGTQQGISPSTIVIYISVTAGLFSIAASLYTLRKPLKNWFMGKKKGSIIIQQHHAQQPEVVYNMQSQQPVRPVEPVFTYPAYPDPRNEKEYMGHKDKEAFYR